MLYKYKKREKQNKMKIKKTPSKIYTNNLKIHAQYNRNVNENRVLPSNDDVLV